MKFSRLYILALLPLFFVGCQAYEEEEVFNPAETSTAYRLQFPLDVRSVVQLHQAPPAGGAATATEDVIKDVVVAGVAQSSYDASANLLSIPSSNLSRAFYFAANLTTADQATVKNSSSPEKLELNTSDYLGGTGSLISGRSIPLVAAVDRVKYSDFTSPLGAVQNVLVYNGQVKFTRAFAKVELDVTLSAGLTVSKIEVINVPKKFALGSAIADYDSKSSGSNYGYTSFTITPAAGKTTFYLPEHAVLNPVKNDPDEHHMTCVVFTYKDAANNVYTKKLRIALDSTQDGAFAVGKDGKVVRNYHFVRNVQLNPATDTPNALF